MKVLRLIIDLIVAAISFKKLAEKRLEESRKNSADNAVIDRMERKDREATVNDLARKFDA